MRHPIRRPAVRPPMVQPLESRRLLLAADVTAAVFVPLTEPGPTAMAAADGRPAATFGGGGRGTADGTALPAAAGGWGQGMAPGGAWAHAVAPWARVPPVDATSADPAVPPAVVGDASGPAVTAVPTTWDVNAVAGRTGSSTPFAQTGVAVPTTADVDAEPVARPTSAGTVVVVVAPAADDATVAAPPPTDGAAATPAAAPFTAAVGPVAVTTVAAAPPAINPSAVFAVTSAAAATAAPTAEVSLSAFTLHLPAAAVAGPTPSFTAMLAESTATRHVLEVSVAAGAAVALWVATEAERGGRRPVGGDRGRAGRPPRRRRPGRRHVRRQPDRPGPGPGVTATAQVAEPPTAGTPEAEMVPGSPPGSRPVRAGVCGTP